MFVSDLVEEITLLGGLITVQFVFAGFQVASSYVMSLGITPLFLVVYGNLTTSIFLFPLCFYFESLKWPKKINLKLWGQILLISLGGVTVFQILMLIGIKKTSPAVASCIPNIAPGLIFIIAWLFRFEKVNMKCIYSRAKIGGTLICIIGAVTMSLSHSSASVSSVTNTQSATASMDKDNVIGTLCIMCAVLFLSCSIVLQAATFVDFPAPLSLSAITAFFAAIFTSVVKFTQEHSMWVETQLMSGTFLIGYILTGGLVGGTCSGFTAWIMKKKGPVFVSTFNPIGTVFSVVLSALTLDDAITGGSILGMLLMFTGLYFVLWAKKKEDNFIEDEEKLKGAFDDSEKPLLS